MNAIPQDFFEDNVRKYLQDASSGMLVLTPAGGGKPTVAIIALPQDDGDALLRDLSRMDAGRCQGASTSAPGSMNAALDVELQAAKKLMDQKSKPGCDLQALFEDVLLPMLIGDDPALAIYTTNVPDVRCWVRDKHSGVYAGLRARNGYIRLGLRLGRGAVNSQQLTYDKNHRDWAYVTVKPNVTLPKDLPAWIAKAISDAKAR